MRVRGLSCRNDSPEDFIGDYEGGAHFRNVVYSHHVSAGQYSGCDSGGRGEERFLLGGLR